jgi:hypothetical protein
LLPPLLDVDLEPQARWPQSNVAWNLEARSIAPSPGDYHYLSFTQRRARAKKAADEVLDQRVAQFLHFREPVLSSTGRSWMASTQKINPDES